MMISKRKLKERLLDICNGAGLIWLENDGYFGDFCMENYGNMIRAVERVFELPDDSRMRLPWRWKEIETIDTLVELVYEAIEYDIKKAK